MITAKVATSNTRGFLRNLFSSCQEKIHFHFNENNIYEVAGKSRSVLAKMIKWKIFDYIGYFQIVKAENVTENICFSYNRFLKTNKPYVIFLENPSALVNYCWERPKYPLAGIRLNKCFNNKNLRAIVCMSKACYEYIGNLYTIPSEVPVLQIYPLIPDDASYTAKDLKNKARSEIVECLYIASDFELKGGRDIVSVFKQLQAIGLPVHLNIITKISSIRNEDMQDIRNMNCISLVEFNLSKSELDEYYKRSAILLNPTRGDSFSLVTLEAMKYGCALLATDIYAIKEMVIDGENGFLTRSMIKVWDADGTLNKYYRTHEKELLRSGKIDEELVKWMIEKLTILVNDRDKLESFCLKSLDRSRNGEFSSEYIQNAWVNLIEGIVK